MRRGGDIGGMQKRPVVRVCVIAATALTGAAALQAMQPATATARSAADRECLARAMYFESNRTSEDGMLAVGTVVANRVKSGRYGPSICGVVGQHRQFAPGVMSRSMTGDAADRARRVADAVLAGKRHPSVREAMFFHTAGLRFRYSNMHYVTVAGGNIFYEKRSASSAVAARENAASMARAYARAKIDQAAAAPVVASIGRSTAPASGGLFAFANPAPATQVTTTIAPAPARVATVPTPQARPGATAVAAPTVLASIGPARSVAAPLPPSRPKVGAGYALASVSAYANPTPHDGGALAAVAALAPAKSKPRVVAITAPVQAAMTPVPPSRPPAFESMPNPRANMVVAMAWSAFD